MSEPENFIARWSRRKRESAEEEAEATKPAAASGVSDETTHTDDGRGEAGGAAPVLCCERGRAGRAGSSPSSKNDKLSLLSGNRPGQV